MGFQDLLAKSGGFEGQNRETGGAMLTLTNSFFLLGVLTSVSIFKCDRESARGRTVAKRFYNLSHAICYSHGTDKKLKK